MEVLEYHDQSELHDNKPEPEKESEVVPTKEPEIVEQEQEEVKDPPIAAVEKKPRSKRLTLQERLALAAKSGGKKKENSEDSPRASVDSVRPVVDEPEKEVTPPVSEEAEEPSIPENFTELEKDDLIVLVRKLDDLNKQTKLNSESKLAALNTQVSTLNSTVSALSATNERLKDRLNTNAKSQDNSVLSKKLEEKELQIKELLEEGAKLSSKEVSLTQTIKKLKIKEIENEEEIDRLKEEAGELIDKANNLQSQMDAVRESEKSIKEERLNFEILQGKFDKLTKERTNIYNELKELKHKRLDVQLSNTKKALEEETKKSSELQAKLEQLSLQFEMFKEQSKVEISQKEYKLEKEKQRYNELRDENYNEIKRLEQKMEQLRIQSENKLVNGTSSSDGSQEIDKKLLSTNEILQVQYTQALENWKLIESSYQNKISQFENDINLLKQKDMNYSRKIKTMTSDLRAKSEDIDELIDIESSLRNEITKLTEKITSKEDEIVQLRQNYELISKQLEEEKAKLEEEKAKKPEVVAAPVQPQSLYLHDLSSSNLFKSQRSVSAISSINHSWDIALGESSTTPRSTLPNSRKVSNTSLYFSPSLQTPTYNRYEFVEQEDDFDVSSPISTYKPKDDDLGSSSNNLTVHGSNGGANIQIMGKLSSQIRRLEIEMITLKDEVNTLTREKADATTEILRLMKQNEELASLKESNLELEKDLQDLSHNYETTLVLLGEKSEQVEELKADVQDLKDLCREQVQQLVSMK